MKRKFGTLLLEACLLVGIVFFVINLFTGQVVFSARQQEQQQLTAEIVQQERLNEEKRAFLESDMDGYIRWIARDRLNFGYPGEIVFEFGH